MNTLKLTGGWRKSWEDDIISLGYKVVTRGGKYFTICNESEMLTIWPEKGDTMLTAIDRAKADKIKVEERQKEREKLYPIAPSTGITPRRSMSPFILTAALASLCMK